MQEANTHSTAMIRPHYTKQSSLLIFLFLLLALWRAAAQEPSPIVRDDFDDGELGEQWTLFPNNDAVSITYPEGAVRVGGNAPGFAALDREDIDLEDFHIAIDLVDWDASFSPIVGIAARTQAGSSGGYVCQYGGLLPQVPEGGFSIRKFGGGGDLILAVDTSFRFKEGDSYRVVFNGESDGLTAAVYDLSDLTAPLTQVAANDDIYTGGFAGLYGLSAPPNKVDMTFDNFIAADHNPYADMLSEGATAHGVDGAAQVIDKSPTTGTEPINAIDGLQFTASTLTDKAVDPASIQLTLNGEDVSESVTTMPDGNNLTVRFDGLQPNQSYEGSLTMANVDGVGTTHEFSFETTDTPLSPQIIRDDFDDGVLGDEWGFYDPFFLSGQARKMEITFENGAVKLFGPRWAPGVSNVGIYRRDVQFEDFYVAVDILDWERPGHQAVGPIARATGLDGVGLPPESALWATIDDARGLNNPSPVGIGLFDVEDRFDITHEFEPGPDHRRSYRLVFTGSGSTVTSTLYYLEDLTAPIAVVTTDQATNPAPGTVGFVIWGGFETGATIDNFIAAESAPYAGLLPDGATAYGVEGAAQVIDKSPATDAEPIDAIDGLQFTVSTLTDKAVDPSSIKLTLNGENISDRLTTTPDGNNLTVSYDSLQPNQTYEGTLTMANIDGVGSTHAFSFETTDTPLPPKILRDDFDDGVLNENWAKHDPWWVAGIADQPMEITFVDGTICIRGPNHMPDVTQVGIFRKDVDWADFYVAIDVLEWLPNGSATGLIGRAEGYEGKDTLNGYFGSLDHWQDTGLGLLELHNESPTDELGHVGGRLSVQRGYRLIVEGEGSNLTTTYYELRDLTAPIAMVTTDRGDSLQRGTVGIAMWSPYEIKVSFDNFIAAESDPYAGLLPDAATAHGVEGAAQVIDKSPATGAEPIDAIDGLRFTVSTLTDKAVDPSSIQLILNGEDVSDRLTTTPDGDNLTVRYDGLQPNQTYEGTLTMANIDGVGSRHEFSFETNETPLPSKIIRDNFDRDELGDEWALYDPLYWSETAEQMRITFEDGRLRTLSPHWISGVGLAGIYRKDVDFANFYLAVDILDWLNPRWQNIGLMARIRGIANPGTPEKFGPDSGFFAYIDDLLSRDGGGTRGLALGGLSDGNITEFEPTVGSYRLVFEGQGESLSASLYSMSDLTTPLYEVSYDAGDLIGSGALGIAYTTGARGDTGALFDNFIAADHNPYADLLPEGATAYGVEGAAQVIAKSPATGAEPIEAIDGLQFTVSTLTDQAVDPSSIELILNGEDVSENLTTMPDGNNLTVRYDGLHPNQSYEGSLTMANMDGVGSTHQFQFETKDTPLPEPAIPLIDITRSEDGTVTVSWSETPDTIGYWLYASDTLEPDSWELAGDSRHWPTDALSWTANTEERSHRFYQLRTMAEQERGALLHAEPIGENDGKLSLEQVKQRMAVHVGSDLFEHRYEVQHWRVIYQTVNWDAEPALGSGLVTLPIGADRVWSMGAFLHGTETVREFSPSFSEGNDIAADGNIALATMGYVGVSPDYIGLGVSTRFHPYLHSETEAASVVDCLRAARTLAGERDIALDQRLVLTGYSQGGHVTLATHRRIESSHADEFEIIASAPGAAPGSLYDQVREDISSDLPYPFPPFHLKAYFAFAEIYDLYEDPIEMLREPYASLEDVFQFGNVSIGELMGMTGGQPLLIKELFQPDYLDALQNDPNHSFWLAFRENSLLDWTPQAPVRFYHCPDDDIVRFTAATLTRDAFLANGATQVEIIEPTKAGFPEATGHGGCADPSLSLAFGWFAEFVE